MPHSRREFFKCGLGFGLGGVSSSTLPATASAEEQERTPSLSLMDYQPRSMLVTEQHAVERARFPAIDMHTHVSSVFRSTPVPGHPLQGSPAERLEQIVRGSISTAEASSPDSPRERERERERERQRKAR